MKNLLTTLIVVFALVSTYSLNAQSQGDFRPGLGLAVGTAAGIDKNTAERQPGFGINIGAEYLITDIISVAPSYTTFFKSNVNLPGSSGDVSMGFNAFNLDGRYYFLTNDVQVYGLFGYSSLSRKSDNSSNSKGGINLGGGIYVPINDDLLFNGQLKYQSPRGGQLVINAGVAYSININ